MTEDLTMFIFRKIMKALVITFLCITYRVKCRSVEKLQLNNDLKSITNITSDANIIDKSDSDPANGTCNDVPEYCNMTKEKYIQMLDDYIYPKPYEWGLIAVHSMVFVVGLVGNALVCVAVYRNSSMRSQVTYCCLVNLAVADFLVILLCLPPTVIWDVTETWFLGDALCKILVYFQSVSVTVSVLTLTFIAMDRWYAIVYPFESRATTNHAKTAIPVIWIIALIFNCPELIFLTTVKMPLRFDVPHLVQCQATWSQHAALVWHIVKFVFVYSTPLLLITLAYLQIVLKLWKSEKILGQAETKKLTSAEQSQLRTRRNVAKMLVVVVIMFAVCFLPVHLLSLLRYMGALDDDEYHDINTATALMSHFLCYFNSALNPLIYNFMSGKFRQEFRRSFCCNTESFFENSTSLTLTSRSKRSELQSLKQRTATTSFMNGSRNADM